MTTFWAIFLGSLQGITEFFPVSSSGHLAIVQNIIPNFTQPGVLLDVILHAGTLCAVLIYFRKRILNLSKNYLSLIIIGTIPAVLIGLIFQASLEELFVNMRVVGFALIFTGLMNWLVDRNQSQKIRSIQKQPLSVTGIKSALVIGLAQAIAIVPGVSRSGSTIFIGTKVGLSKKEAAEFSFLLSVPAVFGANVLQFVSFSGDFEINIPQYFVGFMSALIVGYFAIFGVMKLLAKKKFKYFAYYCFVLGVLVLLFY